MKQYLLFSLIGVILFTGCADSKKDQKGTFVGGQIMNPYNPYFILSKDNKTIDTLFLDQNNQFGKKFENLESGIYSFKHPPENQIMYLEPGDSVLVWLNTMQFDESLNFSGRGAAKSSFLLNMFLNNERNNNMMLSYYKINPIQFTRITDSIKKTRKDKLRTLNEKKKFSKSFLELANNSIDYDFYHLRERYTFLVKKYYSELAQQIPDDFHSYRKDLNFNNTQLKEYYGYLNFIEDYLRTRSIERCLEEFDTNSDCFELHSVANIKYRINLADSLIEKDEIKNIFINRLAIQGLVFSSNAKKIDSILGILQEIDFNGKNLPDLKQMAGIQKSLLPGNNIGDLALLNLKDDIVSLKDISNKPIVTYHWSTEAPEHFKWQHSVISNLRQKYPELEFVGINIDEDSKQSWKKTVEIYAMDTDREYKLNSPNINMNLLKNYLNKLIFLDTNGNIFNGEAQLNTPNFERQILEFLNN
ncbi:hypothetical protein LB467_06985 [Salegentibacter sp. JZCK2]|uniref:TlpA family protein disulfide reductase n=1 Tax=Salegentibacter tibetensis TaxID=2873600 RepID=UPI001CCAE95E|nr:hypothetical protein [Salegentibacter tibetensis]MBZ9729429.1 hypothetical protein [Salegentibacter tibetensis]